MSKAVVSRLTTGLDSVLHGELRKKGRMVARIATEPGPLGTQRRLKEQLKATGRRFKKPKATEGPLRRSPRLKSLRENNKHKTPPPKKTFNWDSATLEEITERLLCDYNKKHGTKLEFVGLLAGRHNCFFCVRYFINFGDLPGKRMHLNFLARRGADPSDKPFVLFAELAQKLSKYHLITLSIVKPIDVSNGCDKCKNCVSHPRHGFRAGLFRKPNTSSGPDKWPEQAAAKLSEFALQCYNKKHGTTIKFEKALSCFSFDCSGVSMDFNEKFTKWVHMNFEVRVVVGGVGLEKVVRLFAELYYGDDGEYVLATLSPAAFGWRMQNSEWRKEHTGGVKGCVFCPADILHPKAFGNQKKPWLLRHNMFYVNKLGLLLV